jgi:peptidoglycan/xylan/chitin deacetylase (PgdA/CDA1 family)
MTRHRSSMLARAMLGLTPLAAGLLVPAHARAEGTVVSLTFDDGRASQIRVAWPILQAHGVNATFYVNSGTIGTTGRMSWNDLQALAVAGNEIGGHTTYHQNLLAAEPDEASREICNDRYEIARHGFEPVSFAYPNSKHDPDIERRVADCGYTSGRVVGNIVLAPNCVVHQACSESIPPLDPYAVRTPVDVRRTTTLATVESAITQAEAHGGGWVVLVMHDVCDCGGTYHTSPALLSGLLDFLAAERAHRVELRTVAQVTGASYRPAHTAPDAPVSSGPNLFRDGSLEGTPIDPKHGEVATCWKHIADGGGRSTWSRVTTAHSGAYAISEIVTRIRRRALRSVVSTQDLGACSVAALPGSHFRLSVWYRSTVPVTLSAYGRNGWLTWDPLLRSDPFPPSADWALATWDFTVPPGAYTGISAGAGLGDIGQALFDDFSLVAA